MDGESNEQEGKSSEDGTIRVVALGVVRREGSEGDELLVERHHDAVTGDPFYRLLGGGVEFGEHSADALRREFREELGVSLEVVSPLGTYEDVFTRAGGTHHELWRLYEAEIAEDWPYEEKTFAGYEPETDEEFECVWKPVAELGPEDGNADTFYPAELLADLGQTE